VIAYHHFDGASGCVILRRATHAEHSFGGIFSLISSVSSPIRLEYDYAPIQAHKLLLTVKLNQRKLP